MAQVPERSDNVPEQPIPHDAVQTAGEEPTDSGVLFSTAKGSPEDDGTTGNGEVSLGNPADTFKRRPERLLIAAVMFEGSLGLGAWVLTWLFGLPNPWTQLQWSLSAAGFAAGITILVASAYLGSLWLRPQWFGRLVDVADQIILPLFSRCRLWHLAVIALFAGTGEELFFRSFVQAGINTLLGRPVYDWLGVGLSALAFGLVHAITALYFFFAAAFGVFAGWLWKATGDLLAPIVAHALYDFVALAFFTLLWPKHPRMQATALAGNFQAQCHSENGS